MATTISLRKETKEMLRRLGAKGQTYDDVIRGLIERASLREFDARWNRILEEEEFIPLDELGPSGSPFVRGRGYR